MSTLDANALKKRRVININGTDSPYHQTDRESVNATGHYTVSLGNLSVLGHKVEY
jgi:hypothetical protein